MFSNLYQYRLFALNNEETAIERATNMYEYRITITWTNVLMTAVVRTQMQSNPAYGDE